MELHVLDEILAGAGLADAKAVLAVFGHTVR